MPACFRILDHHDGVSTARDHAARRDNGCSSFRYIRLGHNARSKNLGIEPQGAWNIVGGSSCVGRPHDEAIDPRSIKPRNVNIGYHVARKNAPDGFGQWDQFFSQGLQCEVLPESRLGFVALYHFEKLLLLRRAQQVRV
jgi:hypothetical protein